MRRCGSRSSVRQSWDWPRSCGADLSVARHRIIVPLPAGGATDATLARTLADHARLARPARGGQIFPAPACLRVARVDARGA